MRKRTTAALLFVDMLGVRASWLKSGRRGAEEAFHRFQECIQHALISYSRTEILDAVIESDSVAVKCRNAESAVSLACRLFRRSFARGADLRDGKRIWLRGVILPVGASAQFRTPSDIARSSVSLTNFTYHKRLLDAISIEKSGYRGMRCLIKSNLVTEALQLRNQFKIGKEFLPRFRHLAHSYYPSRLGMEFQDLLWMNPYDHIGQWPIYQRYMANRLRYAGHNPEELNQAAATQIVFNECEAMIVSRRKRR